MAAQGVEGSTKGEKGTGLPPVASAPACTVVGPRVSVLSVGDASCARAPSIPMRNRPTNVLRNPRPKPVLTSLGAPE
jgi:hypothetical protein